LTPYSSRRISQSSWHRIYNSKYSLNEWLSWRRELLGPGQQGEYFSSWEWSDMSSNLSDDSDFKRTQSLSDGIALTLINVLIFGKLWLLIIARSSSVARPRESTHSDLPCVAPSTGGRKIRDSCLNRLPDTENLILFTYLL
jgi:hypothetical protein